MTIAEATNQNIISVAEEIFFPFRHLISIDSARISSLTTTSSS